MINLKIECNNILFSNRIRLEKQLRKINDQIIKSQDECEHIPALVFYDTIHCVICRKRLDNPNYYINYLSDGPLTGKTPFTEYIDRKISYLQGEVTEVIKEEPTADPKKIVSLINERIKKEE